MSSLVTIGSNTQKNPVKYFNLTKQEQERFDPKKYTFCLFHSQLELNQLESVNKFKGYLSEDGIIYDDCNAVITKSDNNNSKLMKLRKVFERDEDKESVDLIIRNAITGATNSTSLYKENADKSYKLKIELSNLSKLIKENVMSLSNYFGRMTKLTSGDGDDFQIERAKFYINEYNDSIFKYKNTLNISYEISKDLEDLEDISLPDDFTPKNNFEEKIRNYRREYISEINIMTANIKESLRNEIIKMIPNMETYQKFKMMNFSLIDFIGKYSGYKGGDKEGFTKKTLVDYDSLLKVMRNFLNEVLLGDINISINEINRTRNPIRSSDFIKEMNVPLKTFSDLLDGENPANYGVVSNNSVLLSKKNYLKGWYLILVNDLDENDSVIKGIDKYIDDNIDTFNQFFTDFYNVILDDVSLNIIFNWNSDDKLIQQILSLHIDRNMRDMIVNTIDNYQNSFIDGKITAIIASRIALLKSQKLIFSDWVNEAIKSSKKVNISKTELEKINDLVESTQKILNNYEDSKNKKSNSDVERNKAEESIMNNMYTCISLVDVISIIIESIGFNSEEMPYLNPENPSAYEIVITKKKVFDKYVEILNRNIEEMKLYDLDKKISYAKLISKFLYQVRHSLLESFYRYHQSHRVDFSIVGINKDIETFVKDLSRNKFNFITNHDFNNFVENREISSQYSTDIAKEAYDKLVNGPDNIYDMESINKTLQIIKLGNKDSLETAIGKMIYKFNQELGILYFLIIRKNIYTPEEEENIEKRRSLLAEEEQKIKEEDVDIGEEIAKNKKAAAERKSKLSDIKETTAKLAKRQEKLSKTYEENSSKIRELNAFIMSKRLKLYETAKSVFNDAKIDLMAKMLPRNVSSSFSKAMKILFGSESDFKKYSTEAPKYYEIIVYNIVFFIKKEFISSIFNLYFAKNLTINSYTSLRNLYQRSKRNDYGTYISSLFNLNGENQSIRLSEKEFNNLTELVYVFDESPMSFKNDVDYLNVALDMFVIMCDKCKDYYSKIEEMFLFNE